MDNKNRSIVDFFAILSLSFYTLQAISNVVGITIIDVLSFIKTHYPFLFYPFVLITSLCVVIYAINTIRRKKTEKIYSLIVLGLILIILVIVLLPIFKPILHFSDTTLDPPPAPITSTNSASIALTTESPKSLSPIEGYVIVESNICALFETTSTETIIATLNKGTLLHADDTTHARYDDWDLSSVIVVSGKHAGLTGLVVTSEIRKAMPSEVAQIISASSSQTSPPSGTINSTPVSQSTTFSTKPSRQSVSKTRLKGYNSEKNSYTYIEFGEYPIGERIVWRVLGVDKEYALLLSDEILEVMRYDIDNPDWHTSDAKSWLNDVFLKDSFNEYWRSRITNRFDIGFVFLLSMDDLTNQDYGFTNNPDIKDINRSAKPSGNARSKRIYQNTNNGKSTYFTRDESWTDGEIAIVTSMGIIQSANLFDRPNDIGIRPAIWINIENLTLTEGAGTFENPYR